MCGEDKSCGCVAKDVTGETLESKYARAAEYLKAAASPDVIIAAGARDEATGLPSQWHAVLTVEGLRTTDHRAIAKGALTWRQLPLAIFAQFNNAGHGGAPIVGQITSIERDDATGRITAEGTFDLTIEDGQQAARMCDNQTLRWGSVDLEVLESRYVEVSTGGGSGDMDIIDILMDDGPIEPTDWYDEVLAGRIMGYTMVATPAFPQAVIAPIDVELDVPEPMGTAPQVAEGLMAAGVPSVPPAFWFGDPELEEATPLTVTDDGRVFGHLALWNTCHTGYDGVCVTPPHSAKDYAYFLTGQVKTDDGETVRVGHITYNTGHAGSTMGWQDTAAHYDNTGAVAADITVGEDAFGIWVAGALRPGLSEEALRVVRSAPLSGDWRKIGGGLELVAALSVNVPGFPIVAAGRRQGEQVSLVAAGVRPANPLEVMAREVAHLRRAVAPLMGLSVDRLAERVNGKAVVIDIEELRRRVNPELVSAQ